MVECDSTWSFFTVFFSFFFLAFFFFLVNFLRIELGAGVHFSSSLSSEEVHFDTKSVMGCLSRGCRVRFTQ